MRNTGLCYDRGIGGDQMKSFKWFKEVANNGCINSQYMVGNFFYEGCEIRGTEKDIIKVVHWLTKENENGGGFISRNIR
ncbi:7005_t:CDS:2 [Diversispora eburnea]|uniref:7005_t:CDS:1 n=1 Tax=Diversispora eburnea TaxID=1213867 RepID=A0A9N8UWW8_9GLOM|nr:7005_t:CDS:2 [Diversispora eburnea]